MKRLRFLHAPFSYFGEKTSMLAGIFRHLPAPTLCRTFVDAFTGGGSVVVYAMVIATRKDEEGQLP